MSVYEIDTPNLAGGAGLWPRIRSRITEIALVMQYRRMLQAMARMSDEQLSRIGIERKDVPARAHEIIFRQPVQTGRNGA